MMLWFAVCFSCFVCLFVYAGFASPERALSERVYLLSCVCVHTPFVYVLLYLYLY